jgi:hypothetical protein
LGKIRKVSVRLYMDEHVPRAITEGLKIRGISDKELLDRATLLGRK